MDVETHHILSPLTQVDFFANYWESEPLHIERGDSHYFANLISVREIDALLSDTSQRYPELQLADANRAIAVSDYRGADQRVDAAAVRTLHNDGATVILTAAHLKIAGLADLCRTVTSQFMMRSQANVYLSPASQRGFSPHFDTHDVFVLQVSGSKTFRFYLSDIALPFSNDTFDPALCAGAKLQEQITVNAGDTLYIPRGVVHDAEACGDASSLHITLGVFPLVVRDLLQEIVQVAGERDEALRRSVLHDADLSTEAIAAFFDRCVDKDVLHIARSRLVDEIALGDMSATCQTLQNRPLKFDSVVQVSQRNVINTESKNDYIKIRLHGQILEFEGVFADAVQWLLANGNGRIADVPGLSHEQSLGLCTQLYVSGFLEAAPSVS